MMENVIAILNIPIPLWYLVVSVGVIAIAIIASQIGRGKKAVVREYPKTELLIDVTPEQRRELDRKIITREMYSLEDAANLLGTDEEALRVRIRKGQIIYRLVNDKPYIEAKTLKCMVTK